MFMTPFQNVIEINRPSLPVYQTVIERTRQLAVRTQALGVAVGRGMHPTAPPIGKSEQAVTVH